MHYRGWRSWEDSWRGLAALSALVSLACTEPVAVINEEVPPGIVLPVETDSVQPSIELENLLAGDLGWRDQEKTDAAALALWASPYVVSVGDTLDLFVHAVEQTVSLQVYRLGSYGGVGGRLEYSQAAIRGGIQPPCTDARSGMVACAWRRSVQLVVPRNWTGGVYLLKVRDHQGNTWSYPFVLRSSQPHRFTAVVNQFTWQAYNKWGGVSFYSTDPATSYTYPKISFDRPYLGRGGMTATGGAGEAGGSNDLPALRWLEANSYDVGYLSDVDLALGGADLENVHSLLFIGHDEYWTWNERNCVEAYRDAGTHLAFLSANNAYWNIRLAPGSITGRRAETLISFKYQADPEAATADQTTTKFRNPPLSRPESQLIGPLYQGLLPGGSSPPMVAPPDSLLGPETRGFLAAAGLTAGDTLRIGSGTEGDEYFPTSRYTPPGTQMLLRATQPVPGASPRYFHSTFYMAQSGAGVWATGTNHWAAYLDGERETANRDVGELTRIVLNWMETH